MSEDINEALKIIGAVSTDDKPIDTEVDETQWMDVWLTVSEFAYHPEVEKSPAQVYTWIKQGLPFKENEKKRGRKEVNFRVGMKWIKEKEISKKLRTSGIRVVRKPVPGKGKRGGPALYRGYTPKVGDYLSWNRGNKQGPAFGVITKVLQTLICVSVEYQPTTVFLTQDSLRNDLATGKVKVVSEVEIESFIMQQVSRLDFLLHLKGDPQLAAQVKDYIYSLGVVDPGRLERLHQDKIRKWPSEDQIVEEPND